MKSLTVKEWMGLGITRETEKDSEERTRTIDIFPCEEGTRTIDIFSRC